MDSCWAVASRKVILDVIARVGLDDEKKLRAELSAAYPFGERENWPYKVWLVEVRRGIETAKKMKKFGHQMKMEAE